MEIKHRMRDISVMGSVGTGTGSRLLLKAEPAVGVNGCEVG